MGISKAYTNIDIDNYNTPIKNKILPFSLSYDHRVIDGANAARFCNLFKNIFQIFGIVLSLECRPHEENRQVFNF